MAAMHTLYCSTSSERKETRMMPGSRGTQGGSYCIPVKDPEYFVVFVIPFSGNLNSGGLTDFLVPAFFFSLQGKLVF